MKYMGMQRLARDAKVHKSWSAGSLVRNVTRLYARWPLITRSAPGNLDSAQQTVGAERQEATRRPDQVPAQGNPITVPKAEAPVTERQRFLKSQAASRRHGKRPKQRSMCPTLGQRAPPNWAKGLYQSNRDTCEQSIKSGCTWGSRFVRGRTKPKD